MAEKSIIKIIDNLISDGEDFTFKTYTDRNDSDIWGGDPNALWLTWINRIKTLLDRTVIENSSAYIYYYTALKIPLKGYTVDNFNNAKSNYIKSLTTLRNIIIDGDYFEELKDKTILSETTDRTNTKEVIKNNLNSRKVFIVHGHDYNLKADLEVFLMKLNLEPIVFIEKLITVKQLLRNSNQTAMYHMFLFF